jgi:uncharacterized protein (DUF1810 family)
MSFDLERFLVAQEPVYKTVCDELEAGRKSSRWMWFISAMPGFIMAKSMRSRLNVPSSAQRSEFASNLLLPCLFV